MNPIGIIFISILATLIGALPFGLVNLTVLNVAHQNGRPAAMKIAQGATLIEILFGFSAIYLAVFIKNTTLNLAFVRFLAIAISVTLGVFFYFKKSISYTLPTQQKFSFFQGIFLNLMSVQVFLYWVVTIVYLNTYSLLVFSPLNIAVFAVGILLGKMGVLWLYAYFSKAIFSKSDFISRNINRVIGVVLIFSGLLQLIK